MSASGADRTRERARLLAGGRLLLAGLLLAAPPFAAAFAQVGPPLILTPPPEPGSEPPLPPTPPDGPAASPAAAPAAAAPEGERTPAGIQVDPLAAVTADSGGLLDPGQGGLGLDMWRGTPRTTVEALLPRLPAGVASPAMHDLARRLLLSNAAPPEGEGAASLIRLRAERLAAMGDAKDAAALLGLLPEKESDAAAARLGLDAMLLSGDVDGACAESEALVGRFPDEAYFQQALIFCQARAGRTNEAVLGLDLLRELGAGPDPAFAGLVEALAGGGNAPVEPPERPGALDLAMLQAAGRPLPDGFVESGPPSVLAALASDSRLAPALRIAAAERGVALGVIAPEILIQRYLDEPAQPGELDTALRLPDPGYGPHMRAVLYQAAARAAQPAPRAQLLERALQLARRHGGYLAAVAVNRALLMDLTPRPEIAWLAEEAGRALYVAGRYEQAGAWLDLALNSTEPRARQAVPALSLLARIAGGGMPAAGDGRALPGGPDDADSARRAVRLLAILEALDARAGEAWPVPVPPREGDEGSSAVDPILWFAMGDAAAAGRVGETVLLALIGLGADGPAGADPLVLYRALYSLKQVGLEAEARALAFEAAVAGGA